MDQDVENMDQDLGNMDQDSGNIDNLHRKNRLKQLLDLGTEIRNNKTADDNEIVDQITDIIKETDSMQCVGDLKDRLHHTTEVVMDAQIIKMSHELIGEVLQKLSVTEFAEEDLINKILAIVYENDEEDWTRLGDKVFNVCKMTKFSPCFLNGYDLSKDSEHVQKERQKWSKSELTQELRPENLSQIEAHDKNTRNMNDVYKQILKVYIQTNKTPIPYYELIIDPENFMNSVENAFQVAFLARDRCIEILEGDDGFPVVRPLKRELSDDTSEPLQAVCSLDVALVDQMIKKYKIKKCLLKKQLDKS